jgi:hypothetical protein
MINVNSASDAVVEQIKKDAGVWQPDQLRDLLSVGRRQRAADYDSVVRGIAQRYAGDQQALIRGALEKAYPRTGSKMPIDPVNWLRFFARQDSGVYQQPAKRELVEGEDGAPLDPADPRAVAFAEALDDIAVDVLMPEAERRAASGARACVVLLGYQKIGMDDPGECAAHLYWPHDVVTIAHHSAPSEDEALWFIALRQARDSSKDAADVWWVWSREFVEDDAGALVRFGPWTHRRVSEDSLRSSATETYEGILPIAFLRTEAPSGGFWPEPDRDVSLNVDNLNVSRSNRQHVVNMQAHAQAIYSGITRETKELVGGPDSVIAIGNGESMQYLTPSADHAAIEASATRDLQELGVSRGNSPDAYAVTPGAPQSGVAKIIANAPHDQRIAEQRPIFEDFEESDLLPIVIDLLERFSPNAPANFGGALPSVTLSQAKSYEDDASKTQRVLDLLAAKIIDEADARVMLGLSSSRADAQSYLEQSRAPAMGAPRLVGALTASPFASVRETSASSGNE